MAIKKKNFLGKPKTIEILRNNLHSSSVCCLFSKDSKEFMNYLKNKKNLNIFDINYYRKLKKKSIIHFLSLENKRKIDLFMCDNFDKNMFFNDMIDKAQLFNAILPSVLCLNLKRISEKSKKRILEKLLSLGYLLEIQQKKYLLLTRKQDKNLYIITSFGGSGTTFFMNFVKNYHLINDPNNLDMLKHSPSPPKITFIKKAVYLYSNPLNAIVYHFNQRIIGTNFWHIRHCRNMGSDWQKMGMEWDLVDYLNNEEDIFQFENHFNAWSKKNNVDYPIMLVKYEKIWDNLEKIFKFLDIPISEIGKFPKKIKRGSDWRKLPKITKLNLIKMYGKFAKRLKRFPDIKIIKN